MCSKTQLNLEIPMFKNMTALFIALVIAILFSAPAAAAEKRSVKEIINIPSPMCIWMGCIPPKDPGMPEESKSLR